MPLDKNENENEIKNKMQKERRGFLKKTAYAAPTLVALGGLIKPRKANAADFGPPPSDPRGWQ